MTFAAVEPIVRAVLYEGYLLYPYRLSALKNRQRWLFGRLLPRDYSAAHDGAGTWQMRAECLVLGSADSCVEWSVRFLQLKAGGACETAERDVRLAFRLGDLLAGRWQHAFSFPPQLEGVVQADAAELESGLFKLTVLVQNVTPAAADESLDTVLERSLLSTLLLLRVQEGELLSLIDPPVRYRNAAAECRSDGVWPVLVGPQPGAMLLAAPIILYDHPQLAPESPGDAFDGTEIDELLALRIQTLTDDEKRAMETAGQQACGILQRTESLTAEQRWQLHGRLSIGNSACRFQPGDRVRLRPRRSADAIDMLLGGMAATVVAVETDFEGQIHLAVVVDDDPGRHWGVEGLPGHRFFYRPDEVEPIGNA